MVLGTTGPRVFFEVCTTLYFKHLFHQIPAANDFFDMVIVAKTHHLPIPDVAFHWVPVGSTTPHNPYPPTGVFPTSFKPVPSSSSPPMTIAVYPLSVTTLTLPPSTLISEQQQLERQDQQEQDQNELQGNQYQQTMIFTNRGIFYLDNKSPTFQFIVLAAGVFFFFGAHNYLQEAMMTIPGFRFGVMLGYMKVFG